MAVSDVTPGAWMARWGDYVVGLRGDETQWKATVWGWRRGRGSSRRIQLAMREGFATPYDAVTWACGVLRERGTEVFIIDRPSLTLEGLLRFRPAPEAVA